MRKTKLVLASATIFQLEAGEQKAIRDGGDLYVCVQSEEGLDSEDEPAPKKASEPAPARAEAKAEAPAPATPQATGGQLTEAQMMEMPTGELLDICDELGINPDSYEGKNTNKKVRLLILDHYANGGAETAQPAPARTAEVVDDTPAPTGRASRGESARPARGAVASDEPKEIPRADWDNLKEGDLVLAQLKMDNEEDSKKLWEAQIVGWDIPKGVGEECLYVLFLEDDTEDYLREADKLFTYKKQL